MYRLHMSADRARACEILRIFRQEIEYTIGWRCVKQIGDDVILVDIDTAKTCKKCAEKD